MTPEQLLQPRYEVIADYPNSPFTIGEILSDYGTLTRPSFIQRSSGNQIRVDVVDKYPHLFRKLEWWEKRKPEDMPEYVKYQNNYLVYKVVHNFIGLNKTMCKIYDGKINIRRHYEFFQPATLQDYTDYLTKTNQQ